MLPMKWLRQKIKMIRKSPLLLSAGQLFMGSVAAQVITFIALLVTTRLYSPDDFSVLAIYSSVLYMVSTVACLRFEIAIPLPKHANDAEHLLDLSLLIVFALTLLVAIVLIIFDDVISGVVGPQTNQYIYFLPLGMLMSGIYSPLQYWAVRCKRFEDIAKSRVHQAGMGAGAQIVLGALGVTPAGLIVGQILNVSMGIKRLSNVVAQTRKSRIIPFQWKALNEIFVRYKRFPKYYTWEALANVSATHVPVTLIAAFAVGPEAGFLMVAMRLLSAPTSMLGQAISQVYYREAIILNERGALKHFTLRIMGVMFKYGLIPFVFIALASL